MLEGKPVDIVRFNGDGEARLPDTLRRLADIDNKLFAVYLETEHGKTKMIWESIEASTQVPKNNTGRSIH